MIGLNEASIYIKSRCPGDGSHIRKDLGMVRNRPCAWPGRLGSLEPISETDI